MSAETGARQQALNEVGDALRTLAANLISIVRGAGKPLTCGDGNLRVQERRSAAERGMVGTGVYPVVCPFLESSCDSGRRSTPTCNGRMPGSAVAGMLGDSR